MIHVMDRSLLHHEILKRYAIFAFLLLTALIAYADDNVVALEECIEYTLQEENGKISAVKKNSETIYTALRADDAVIAFEMFGDHVSIDKASAPGVKPYYRSWEPEDLFHTGSRICIMNVPLSAGKQAKVSFASTIKWPEQFCGVYLCSPYFTKMSTVKVVVPKSLASRYGVSPYNLPDNMRLESSTGKNGETVYTVFAEERKPIKSEPHAPSLAIDAPQLIITGHFPDTEAIYTYMKGFADAVAQSSAEVEALAARITDGCASSLAKIDSVAAWVRRNIRYVAIENGEYALRPSSPAEVLERRYGDCKGSANLIKALLRHCGIDARLVWTGTVGDVTTDWVSNPSLMSGNHQIACAILPDTTIYLDGTVAYAPDGFIPESLRGAKVIIEDGDNCIVSEIPHTSRNADGEAFNARLAVEGNDLVGMISRTFTGSERTGVVATYSRLDGADRLTFRERMLTYPKKNLSADNTELLLDGFSSPECTIRSEKVVDRQAVRKVGDKLYIGLQPIRMLGLEPVAMRDRTRGMAPLSSSNYSAEIHLAIPEGYAVERLPEVAVIDNEWYKGRVEYAVDGDEVICRGSLSVIPEGVPFKRLDEYNDIVKNINRISNNQIIVRHYEEK